MSQVVSLRITHHGRSKAEQQARAREQCRSGHHRMHTTLTPGEQVCLVCGLLTFCPLCEPRYLQLKPTSRAHVLACATHRQEGDTL